MRFLLLILLWLPGSAFGAEGDFAWNMRTSPIAWVIGPNLRADFKWNESWTFGVAGNSLNRRIKAVKMKGQTAFVFLTYAFNSAFEDTWFVDAGGFYGDIRAEAKNSSGQIFTRQLHNSGARLTAGYQWFWRRFNLSFAGGADWNSAGDQYVMDASGNRLERIELRKLGVVTDAAIGMAF